MSLEVFPKLDYEPCGNCISKRDFLEINNQQGSNLKHSVQKVETMFGENNKYHEICNKYPELDIAVRNRAAFYDVSSEKKLMEIAFNYCFKEARLSTTGGSDLEHNQYVGQISTIMRPLTSKNGDLLSHFD